MKRATIAESPRGSSRAPRSLDGAAAPSPSGAGFALLAPSRTDERIEPVTLGSANVLRVAERDSSMACLRAIWSSFCSTCS